MKTMQNLRFILEAFMKRSLKFLIVAIALLVASPLYAQLYVTEIPFDSAHNLIKMTDGLYLGEAVGVATNY